MLIPILDFVTNTELQTKQIGSPLIEGQQSSVSTSR
jgi:hypothetical protein